jgi:hypothetical protein
LDNAYQRDYTRNPYAGYESSPDTLFPRPYGDDGATLGPKEVVLGVLVAGVPKAYPHRVLQERIVVNDIVGGVAIVVTFAAGSAQAFEAGDRTFEAVDDRMMKDGEGGLWDMMTGAGPSGSLTPVRSSPSFWFAWYDFYPETLTYGFDLTGGTPRSGDPIGTTLNPRVVLLVLGAVASLGAGLLLYRTRGGRRSGGP